ncbi:histidine utilization repressor [Pseudemcibacter aquimaris]|uniref:histidine utilization repressor n=1 Tax=Pseudemcibacter aquimaris TaxID=2857064 RepID=UPI002010F5A7|nr:histidine utilization repressor [Pseudemcibacter aquimaris]MCC3861993.1 histidine utilization repressor [Pseudemcibacter aquimaris]WDU58745.1 histidine utilization repressor [Pseudemcibacter aquimaris]
MTTDVKSEPLYLKIKNHILDRIDSGEWGASMRVPSENELVKEFSVSRMTTNRALRELTDEGYLIRVAGVGTFVAELRAKSNPLEIHNIADEIRARHHEHSADVLKVEVIKANEKIATIMNIEVGDQLTHTQIVHKEQGIPIQLEDRLVNERIVPGYGEQDYTEQTPYEYLIKKAPLQKVEHIVKAIIPTQGIKELLDMSDDDACLLVERRTWTKGQVASTAKLYHPGSRYELSGLFKPE